MFFTSLLLFRPVVYWEPSKEFGFQGMVELQVKFGRIIFDLCETSYPQSSWKGTCGGFLFQLSCYPAFCNLAENKGLRHTRFSVILQKKIQNNHFAVHSGAVLTFCKFCKMITFLNGFWQ